MKKLNNQSHVHKSVKTVVHFIAPAQRPKKITNALVQRIVNTTLNRERKNKNSELNVVFVNNKKIKELNWAFLKEREYTDVIAFPYEKPLFGDIYISIDQAAINAKLYHQTLEQELSRLIIHGLLHIIGYDDHKPADKKLMWSRQERTLQLFFPPPPPEKK